MKKKLSAGFYFQLYLRWLWWVNSRALFYGAMFSFIVTLLVYLNRSQSILLDDAGMKALSDIFFFAFNPLFSFAYVIMLVAVFKALFKWKVNKKTFVLHDCEGVVITEVLFSDVISLWRKWLFVTVWFLLLVWGCGMGLYRLVDAQSDLTQWFTLWNMVLSINVIGGMNFSLGIRVYKEIGIVDA